MSNAEGDAWKVKMPAHRYKTLRDRLLRIRDDYPLLKDIEDTRIAEIILNGDDPERDLICKNINEVRKKLRAVEKKILTELVALVGLKPEVVIEQYLDLGSLL